MTPFLGVITMFAGSFVPAGYLACEGQLLDPSQNSSLFSLMGTTYGGDGSTTFAIPDLRGRSTIGVGQGTGLSNTYAQGLLSGNESISLTSSNMPGHTHTMRSFSGAGNAVSPSGNILANGPQVGAGPGAISQRFYDTNAATANVMGASSLDLTGSGIPFSILQPSLGLYVAIALQGYFPSRN